MTQHHSNSGRWQRLCESGFHRLLTVGVLTFMGSVHKRGQIQNRILRHHQAPPQTACTWPHSAWCVVEAGLDSVKRWELRTTFVPCTCVSVHRVLTCLCSQDA
mmetsp:Transcript_144723/g.360795  ORF Transcript_144723/g.360795 Transcript_144723/m.360795 type:complete len:103 (-) Transcript_144723:64-372(-)